jgi:hypothetical protein
MWKMRLLKLKGRDQFRQLRCRYENNIKMNVKEIGCEVVNWTDLLIQALVNTVILFEFYKGRGIS